MKQIAAKIKILAPCCLSTKEYEKTFSPVFNVRFFFIKSQPITSPKTPPKMAVR